MSGMHAARLLVVLLSAGLAGIAGCSGTVSSAREPETERSRGEAASAGRDGRVGETTEREHAPDVVILTPEQLERLELRVEPAAAGSARAWVTAPATVAFDPDREARLGPRLSAKVVRVTRDLGEHVEAGDTVAIFESVALGKAKARYLTARARLETARANYEREKGLAEEKISSQAEYLEAQARFVEAQAERDALREELRLYGISREAIEAISPTGEEPLSFYRLRTPLAGVVHLRDLVPGETVEPTDTPVHVVDTSRMWVWIDVFEREIPLLEPDQAMELSVRALPGRRFRGTVTWISRQLDEKNRTVRLRAVVDNPEGLLRAGMFGTARIRTATDVALALIPVGAVQRLEGDPVVFVPDGAAGRFRALPVEPGEEGGGQVEILGGLRPGDPVVTAGAFDLMSALTAHTREADH